MASHSDSDFTNKQRRMKMSKPRTKEQKLRRKYLEDCKAKGIKPMSIDDWKAKFANKTSKPSYKSVKPAKKGRKVIV